MAVSGDNCDGWVLGVSKSFDMKTSAILVWRPTIIKPVKTSHYLLFVHNLILSLWKSFILKEPCHCLFCLLIILEMSSLVCLRFLLQKIKIRTI